MDRPDYRPFVPASSESSIVGATPRAHAQARVQIPRVKELFETWAKLGAEPFKGLTTDGCAFRSIPKCGGTGRTPSFTSSIMACVSMR
jgi:hypothetical protein